MVGAVVWSCCLIALKDEPSASMRINLARNTYPAGRARDCAMLLRSECCCLVSKISLPVADSLDANRLVMVTLRQATSCGRLFSRKEGSTGDYGRGNFEAIWWSPQQMENLDPSNPPPKNTRVTLSNWEYSGPVGGPHPDTVDF